ncbi:hypothetical protein BBBOND_0108950 [Babesia bigemina]|uniref:Uncharacterized protein n=1 Tax=Babesia bigemina TaxID=5866 RepID=A0A061D3D7_BABBI|nr:hypothetical protein BBBOND_0108950 [Babesia bigemina]CDR94597.1 hypothetical protein BBBOND_0108950 [Babesia bigemina]|eukprot:XP_012766783.1 hypothetical protein BBBOND_0108950 [Babesia bigemina]
MPSSMLRTVLRLSVWILPLLVFNNCNTANTHLQDTSGERLAHATFYMTLYSDRLEWIAFGLADKLKNSTGLEACLVNVGLLVKVT